MSQFSGRPYKYWDNVLPTSILRSDEESGELQNAE